MGEAVRTSGMPRSEIFLATKILSAGGTVEKSYKKCLGSVTEIDGNDGYVDLFLIHTARLGKEKRKEIWLALERLVEEGKVRNIGVSNWGIGHIEEMKEYAKIWPPAVNQIEVWLFLIQNKRELLNACLTIRSVWLMTGSCILSVNNPPSSLIVARTTLSSLPTALSSAISKPLTRPSYP